MSPLEQSHRSSSEPNDVHTCHAECPCQRGEEPRPDFLPVEGSLVPGLLALARLRRQTGKAFPWERDHDEHGEQGRPC